MAHSGSHGNHLASHEWSYHSHSMEMTVTQFKAKCLGVIEKVQKEKSRITITRHGRPAAELIPISASHPGVLFGRASETTVIFGDLLTTEEPWDAED
jgi:prevent-host-death family protein